MHLCSYVQSCLEFQYHIKRLTFYNPTVKAYKVGGLVAWGWTGVMMELVIWRVRTTLCTYFKHRRLEGATVVNLHKHLNIKLWCLSFLSFYAMQLDPILSGSSLSVSYTPNCCHNYNRKYSYSIPLYGMVQVEPI